MDILSKKILYFQIMTDRHFFLSVLLPDDNVIFFISAFNEQEIANEFE